MLVKNVASFLPVLSSDLRYSRKKQRKHFQFLEKGPYDLEN